MGKLTSQQLTPVLIAVAVVATAAVAVVRCILLTFQTNWLKRELSWCSPFTIQGAQTNEQRQGQRHKD